MENDIIAGEVARYDLFASVSREDLIHLCIFLAGYQAKLQEVRGECMSMVGDDKSKAWETVVNNWPIIQGSENQIYLIRIGELGYDAAAVARAMKGVGEPAAQLAFDKASVSEAASSDLLARLPHTADGKPILLGDFVLVDNPDPVYFGDDDEVLKVQVKSLHDEISFEEYKGTVTVCGEEWERGGDLECYSTKESALQGVARAVDESSITTSGESES